MSYKQIRRRRGREGDTENEKRHEELPVWAMQHHSARSGGEKVRSITVREQIHNQAISTSVCVCVCVPL